MPNLNQLLDMAEAIEEAQAKLRTAKEKLRTVNVEVTDPIAKAVVNIDSSLVALDQEIGSASRKAHRERAKTVEP